MSTYKYEGKNYLSQIIGDMSHALDLSEGQMSGHSLRCCWIGSNIGRKLDLKD